VNLYETWLQQIENEQVRDEVSGSGRLAQLLRGPDMCDVVDMDGAM
jgi:hypothetical protein